MKIRIRFGKYGSLKFVGHLDLMRYFQRALRRAGVKMRYSGGFNPHPIMSFAAPLGVGLTSDGEYVDIEVTESGTSAQMKAAINDVLTDELRILSYRKLPDNIKTAMAQVAAADYTVRFYPEKQPEDPHLFESGVKAFLSRGAIPVRKESRSGEKTVDIRPMIYEFLIGPDLTVRMKVAAGSAANLKPETLMEAYMESISLCPAPVSFLINRDELYALADGKDKKLVSLDSFGEDIV